MGCKMPLRHIDLGLAIAITLAGLTLFAFSGLQGNSHAASPSFKTSSADLSICASKSAASVRTTTASSS